MAFDFETLLVILTLLTGVIWAWDKWRRRGEPAKRADEEPWWLDLSRSLFPVILAVLVIRSFIVEPFRIPSGSMIPTLYSGDFILVNKFAYGVRLPAVHAKFLDTGEPERGDVAVFRFPVDPRQDYIKRIVGVPGDHIIYHDKHLYINGELVPQTQLGPYRGAEPVPGGQLRREHLGEEGHMMVVVPAAESIDIEYTVPPRHYFVLGDNRDRSADSRYWGPVPEGNLVGKAFMVWMSWNPQERNVNWGRIGQQIE